VAAAASLRSSPARTPAAGRRRRRLHRRPEAHHPDVRRPVAARPCGAPQHMRPWHGPMPRRVMSVRVGAI
jgi:hypothetical protein